MNTHELSRYLSANAPYFESFHLLNQEDGSVLSGYPSIMRKQSGRKDRHSKIYTSQGPRDRRVRLSIAIARKFFDLQEMLGFDKPSKTLDWLLTKSKAAIKDLVQKKQLHEDSSDKKFKGVAIDPKQIAAANLVKESRAKARARARERTREKMRIKQLNGLVKKTSCYSDGFNLKPTIPNCSRVNLGVCEPIAYYPLTSELVSEELVHESVLFKRKLKHPAMIFGLQHNFRDMNPNYNMPSVSNASENWDLSCLTSQTTNLCSLLDQHKFMNRSISY